MANTRRNYGAFSCAIYDLDNIPDIYTVWNPDPVGPEGTTMNFFISQQLTKPSTVFTQLFFSFND
ncbi:21479_t:CDS:1, partial [Gigaspora margarita]